VSAFRRTAVALRAVGSANTKLGVAKLAVGNIDDF